MQLGNVEIGMHPITNRDDSPVQETMLFFNPAGVGGQQISVGGKLMAHKAANPERASDMLVVGHGLPAIEWRKQAEDKIKALIAEHRNLMAFILVPCGIRATAGNLNIPEEDARVCLHENPDFFRTKFSISRFIKSYAAALRFIEKMVLGGTKIHLAGHSYGAMALIYALQDLLDRNGRVPDSALLLAPFVKLSLEPNERGDYRPDEFEIVNHAVTSELTANKQPIQILREVLESCGKVYLCRSFELVHQHRQLFTREFYRKLDRLHDIPAGRCRVRVVLGSKDPYIGMRQSEWLRQRFGTSLSTQTLPDDGHGLASLDWKKMIV